MQPSHQTTLYLLCGKIAAGKSTLAQKLAARPATLLISEDHWTSKLFGDEMRTIDDHSRLSERLRSAMGPHVVDVLRLGVSVVLDFPANVASYRAWMRSLFTQASVAHELHFLDIPDEICKQRLRERNSGGKHPFQVAESEYELFTSYFEPVGGCCSPAPWEYDPAFPADPGQCAPKGVGPRSPGASAMPRRTAPATSPP